MTYPKMEKLKLTWMNEDGTIGRTLLNVEELEEVYIKEMDYFEYKKVVKNELFEDIGRFWFTMSLIEKARNMFKIEGEKMQCFRPNVECPAFLTWKTMSGGVMVAPRMRE